MSDDDSRAVDQFFGSAEGIPERIGFLAGQISVITPLLSKTIIALTSASLAIESVGRRVKALEEKDGRADSGDEELSRLKGHLNDLFLLLEKEAGDAK